jgi:hypothetical protein
MTREIRSVRDGWQTYLRDVVPRDAGPIQRLECERAFFGGAVEVLGTVCALSNVSEDEGVRELDRLLRECQAHMQTLVT